MVEVGLEIFGVELSADGVRELFEFDAVAQAEVGGGVGCLATAHVHGGHDFIE